MFNSVHLQSFPDLSSIITKCNCNKSTPKAHKLCALLNVIYNFELKCPDCHADYNLSIHIHNKPFQKACNLIQFILVLLVNIIKVKTVKMIK